MNSLLTLLSLITGAGIALFVPQYGAPAVLLCLIVAVFAGILINRIKIDKRFLMYVFVSGLLCRVAVGTVIFAAGMQEFFGGDALTYDSLGHAVSRFWQGEIQFADVAGIGALRDFWAVTYYVAGIYTLVGRNMLATQLVNSVIGAATAPLIYLCAQHIFSNIKVARVAALFVAFYPSLVLWSSQGLKDGPIVFLLAVIMLTTLKLGEKLRIKYLVVLLSALLCLLGMRFYVFYMAVVAIGGAFMIGMRSLDAQSLARQFVVVVGIGLALTYLGVLRTASAQLENYGSLEAVQRSRSDLAHTAQSGFGRDVDVSTTSGAISAIPVGMTYLLFAPFPWQLASLRQSITLPEMIVWWMSFPLLVLGIWFTIKHRLRQALPILLFSSMLTLAYSVFQGNIGTAYRQRSQLLVFYFIFVAVGFILLKERREDAQHQMLMAKQKRQAELLGKNI